MRAVRSTGDGVEVVRVPAPSGDGVRVRVRSSGICGSDLHLVPYRLPVTMGHEFAGVLDDGTTVAVQPSTACGRCDPCAAGDDHLCRTAPQGVLGVGRDGGLADEVLVDESSLVPLPPGLDVAVAAMVEPMAVAVHAVHRAGPLDGRRVLVVGAGTIGLLAAAVAHDAGADVVVAARHDAQLRATEIIGVGHLPVGEHDVVVEAAGTQSAVDAAIEHTRPGGRIVVVSTWWDAVSLGPSLLMKEVALVPAFTYGHHHGEREFAAAAQALAARPDVVDAVVTHRFGLDDAAEAFRVAADRGAGAIKVLLEP